VDWELDLLFTALVPLYYTLIPASASSCMGNHSKQRHNIYQEYNNTIDSLFSIIRSVYITSKRPITFNELDMVDPQPIKNLNKSKYLQHYTTKLITCIQLCNVIHTDLIDKPITGVK
jgi:hypothetical protein